MQITVDIGEYLIEQAKDAAAKTHRSLDEFLADAILVALDRVRRVRSREKFMFTTSGSGGIFLGVDMDNSSALLDTMDGIEPRKD
jgi:hypothetical protein